ncbi:threonine-phosphate decarboxylase CobD [Pseudanabaena sp. 'Roaring Creek']|uniref:threonine-phosphate decarboxylase CobD n=1 Tax=Pseudanabaena sp. 'Roaring Creek' TaxID=1681830 RepID=UPI0006D84D1F|nr:threonine-phosphate decarboxylase CobD [Pseudanabaena sp. 'Roaring Creek']
MQSSERLHPIHGGNRQWAAEMANISPAQILDFSASINPLGVPKSAIAAIQSQFTDLSHYPDPEYTLLRHSLGEFHQLSSEWILAGNGVAELLTWVGRDLSQLVATVLFTPAFTDYYRALKTFDCQVEKYPFLISNQAVSFKTDLPEISNSHTKGILINNPHNPTGYLFSRDSILPYLERFALVVIDEAFMDFLAPEQQQSLIDLVPSHPNLVILRSLTKFYSLPALRLGYAIAHPDRLRRWQAWRDPWCVNSFAAAAGIAVLSDREFQQQTWTWLKSAKSQLFKGLSQILGLIPLPNAANYLLVQTEIAGSFLQKELLQRDKILIRDCLSFPELGDRYFRVAVRLENENQKLIDSLSDLF